jgi:tetratricopeptide (TPR) repeat protein
MQKAEAYAHHAIELIPNMPKPPDVDDAAFEKAKNERLSMAHSGLGLIDINRQKFEDARTELTQAVQLASEPDLVDYYLLGNADVQTSYYNDAVAAFDKCAASGPLAAQCKARSDSAKHDAATKLGR